MSPLTKYIIALIVIANVNIVPAQKPITSKLSDEPRRAAHVVPIIELPFENDDNAAQFHGDHMRPQHNWSALDLAEQLGRIVNGLSALIKNPVNIHHTRYFEEKFGVAVNNPNQLQRINERLKNATRTQSMHARKQRVTEGQGKKATSKIEDEPKTTTTTTTSHLNHSAEHLMKDSVTEVKEVNEATPIPELSEDKDVASPSRNHQNLYSL